MMEDYKSAMNRITADEKFKAQLKQKLSTQENRPKCKKPSSPIHIPVIASLASAAVLALMIYSSTVIILPMLRNDEFALSYGTAYKEPNKTTHPTPDDSSDSNFTTAGEVPENTLQTDDSSQVTDNTDAYIASGTASSAKAAADDTTQIKADEEKYNIVTFAGSVVRPLKGSRAGGEIFDYDGTFHFKFIGFNKYGVRLDSSDVVFTASLYDDYTLADFFADYYTTIIGQNGRVRITSGMLDNFFDVSANQERQINVYLNGVEVVNLNNIQLTEIWELSDVYFTVTVT